MGVPRLVRVSSSLSSRESMLDPPHGAAPSVAEVYHRATIPAMMRLLAVVTLAGMMAGCRESVEGRFIYYPSRSVSVDPSSVGLRFRELLFPSADGVRLHG